MAVQSAKNKFMSTEPLCLTCANAVPQACEFIRQKKPAPALEAMGAKYLSQEFTRSPGKGTYYKVTACPKYTRGPLPRIAKARGIEKLDLTCPKCNGSDKVKVAPTSLLEPAEWYCRCFRCNKAFRPKKKGD